jgi:uncharacterized protein (DUF433 family)
LPTYRIGDAARYSGISSQVASNWYYRVLLQVGYVAIPDKERHTPLNYLQLIELAIVSTFRELKVPLRNIADARLYFAQVLTSEYPFAEYQFKTDGFHLLMNVTTAVPTLVIDYLIVADANGQLAWNAMVEDKLLEFDYDEQCGIALKWFGAGRKATVLVDPRVSFGAPMVRGIPTFVLKGRWEAGEAVGDIREDFSLQDNEIRDALAFEGVSQRN